jgi:hypothetical protein
LFPHVREQMHRADFGDDAAAVLYVEAGRVDQYIPRRKHSGQPDQHHDQRAVNNAAKNQTGIDDSVFSASSAPRTQMTTATVKNASMPIARTTFDRPRPIFAGAGACRACGGTCGGGCQPGMGACGGR